MAQNFTTDVTQWQGVDNEPILGSKNFVESNGIGNITKATPVLLEPVRSEAGKRVKANGTIDNSSTAGTILVYEVLPNKAYDFMAYAGATVDMYFINWFDSLGNFIYHEPYRGDSTAVTIINQVVVSPANAAYCYMNTSTSQIVNNKYRLRSISNLILNDVRREGKPTEINPLRNKKVSLMGDSNWTFSGVSTGDSSRYCLGGAIEDVRDTWWGKLLLLSDSTLEVDASVGSSSVTDNEYYGVPGYLSRVDTLGNPDCVMIGGGMNEPPDVTIGTFDPTKPIGQLDTLVFADAYDKMIRLIKEYYSPEYILMIVHPKTRKSLSDMMIEIASYYNIDVVDLREISEYVTYVDNVHYDFNGSQVVCSYITDSLSQYGKIAADKEQTYIKQYINNNTVEEVEHPITEENVAGYLTDKNKSIIGKLMKNGAVEWLVENSKDIANNAHFESIDELLSYVSSEVPDNGNGVIKYLTDKDGKIIATINNVGDTEFKGGGGFDGELTKSRNIGFDAVKVLTDRKGSVIGYIDSEGGVYFYNLLNESSNKNDDVSRMMNLVANGGRGRTTLNILNQLPKKSYSEEGLMYSTNGFMSFHDDDTIEWQLPVSHEYGATPETRISSNVGGFASFLYPFMKSITERHKQGKKLVLNATTKGYDLVDDDNPTLLRGKLVYGLAAEGQRIGLIEHLQSDVDSFEGKLNLCGELASKLHYKYGWDIMCHSMTARYIGKSYWVESLDDPLVAQIETVATKHAPNYFDNSYIHCNDTNLDYEYRIDDNNHGEWHLVSDHYLRPYLAKSLASNAPLYFNPRYSEYYQVDEWRKRAQVAGLPFIDCGVSWGTSASMRNALVRYEYFKDWIMTGAKQLCNEVPLGASGIVRTLCYPQDNTNRWQDSYFDFLKGLIDEAVAGGKWLILNGHVYNQVEQNHYFNSIDYGERKCDTYNAQWIVPLKQEELETIDENNYWEVPPSRLGINSWAEWYPCPGTTYDMIMNVIEYGISKGIEFGSTEEGLRRFANIFCIGQKNLGEFDADKRLADSEKNETWRNHIIIGCDGTLSYNIK
jgi:hypothetical protein